MTKFEIINIFYTFIYEDDINIFHYLDTFEKFCEFKNWLTINNIEIHSVENINESQYNFTKSCNTIEEVSHLLHININEELNHLKEKYQNKTHALYFGEDSIDLNNVFYHQINDLNDNKLIITDPYYNFLEAFLNIDKWPGVLIFTKDRKTFYPIRNNEDVIKIQDKINNNELYIKEKEDHTYYLHLSDSHLGINKKDKKVASLFHSLDRLYPFINNNHKLKTVITGDLMNSPSKKNMYAANDFMVNLKKKYHTDLTFVLGNHDMIVHGVNIGGRQKSKVIAYLLGEKIKVLEDDKVILIKLDSNSQGSLARGSIGERQLYEIEEELSTIDHLEDYTLIALLHHHVIKIEKSDFLKVSIKEKAIFGKLLDSSKALIDADLFKKWLSIQKIKYVLHGHKHVPFFINKNNTYYISAGSCTGGGLKEEKSNYISYNLLKYNNTLKKMDVCFIFYVDHIKTSRIRIEINRMEENNDK